MNTTEIDLLKITQDQWAQACGEGVLFLYNNMYKRQKITNKKANLRKQK